MKNLNDFWNTYGLPTADDREPQVPIHEVASRRGWQIWLDYHSVLKAVDDRRVDTEIAKRAKRALDDLRYAQKADLKAKIRVAPFWANLLVDLAIILTALLSVAFTALVSVIIGFVLPMLVSAFVGYEFVALGMFMITVLIIFELIDNEYVDPLMDMALSRLLDGRIRRLEQAIAKMPRNLITG